MLHLRHTLLIVMLVLLCSKAYGQSAHVTINRNGASIDMILDDVERQTNHLFIYGDDVDLSKKIDIHVKKERLSLVLSKLFDNMGIAYFVEGKHIILKKIYVPTTIGIARGTVLDNTGAPIPGAAIILSDEKQHYLTDNNGQFSFELEKESKLYISCLGFNDITRSVGPGQNLTIILQEEVEPLKGTIVIGYGVQKKSNVTGAVSSIESDYFSSRDNDDISHSIAGISSGVQVITTSGAPDDMGDIRIRGISSNSSSASNPLYVVDGLLVPNMKNIRPENVEKIEILKDGASAAIYGAQAGNGVVVITTKKGKEGGQVFYHGSYSMENLAWKPDLMDAQQYIRFATQGGLLTSSSIYANWDKTTNTDWFDELFPGGYSHRHTVGLQGASERFNYFTSLNYRGEDGILYGDIDKTQSLTFQLNASFNVNNWISFGTTNTFQSTYSSGHTNELSGSDQSSMSLALIMDPLTPFSVPYSDLSQETLNKINDGERLLTLPNGNYIVVTDISTNQSNPLIDIFKYTESQNQAIDLNGTLYANLFPINGITVTSRFGYRIAERNKHYFEEPWYASSSHIVTENNFFEKLELQFNYQWDNYLNYNHIFSGKHNVELMAGMSYIDNRAVSISGKTNKLADNHPNFRYLSYSTEDAIDSVGGSRSRNGSISYFTRACYNFENKYFIQASFRADAFDSSRLSVSNRWGYFPSVSGGWIITREPWMKYVNNDILGYLKLYASWGINGNINALSEYPYQSTISIGADQYNLGTSSSLTLASYPERLANKDLKWEKSNQINIGLDAYLLENRLSTNINIYKKYTDGLLTTISPSYTSGQDKMYINAGSVLNQGYELDLNWRDSFNGISYRMGANLSRNKNLVTDLIPSVTRINGADVNNGHKATICEKGHELWFMYGYIFDGVDPDTGNCRFRDIDEDGAITPEDMTEIGSSQPKFTYGMSFAAEYKGFDLSVYAYGIHGNDIWYAALRSGEMKNMPEVFYTEAWTTPGDQARYPRYGQALSAAYARSSACIYDGSYLRINQIQLGYSFGESLRKKSRIEKLRLYLSLNDYFTFSKYLGSDPVTVGDNSGSGMGIDRGTFPSSKKMTFGIELSL